MDNLKIKEIVNFVENEKNKTKLVISEDNKDKEIVLEGSGSIKVAINA